MNKDTICAIATSNNSIAGISIIRISGEKSLEIAKKILTKFQSSEIKPRYMYLTDVVLENGTDKCLAVYFKAPYSFTGEDVVEIHLHGGIKLTEMVLKKCIENGARLATRGEFSKQAFLNGKSSLESLEGVIDIINAESEAELSAGYNLANGKLSQELYNMQNKLTDIIAEIDVALDYPEEDIEYTTENQVKKSLQEIYDNITNLIATSKNGKMLKNGINIAIVGKPNVGKSSLLNALLNFDRAIVTDIAGTTRDSIEESFEYKNVKFNVCDTAGIRDAQDKVEIIGIDRAIAQIKSSNIILFVVDLSRELDEEDKKIMEIINSSNVNCILVYNKNDLKQDIKPMQIELNKKVAEIEISAKNAENITKLKDLLYDFTLGKDFDTSSLTITNERHLQALKEANQNILQALNAIGKVSLDCVVLDIKNSWNSLGKITGKTITDEVLDAIFTKFCLGK
ncbi:MAG: tRNA uridine-5-carboxymethylaminomethyl(34) synthesis GTPase MnmE [Clostridia bacterium]|nr:tRNA uridine-5-carboxymethylaminomethyl(34) synthesis GTPase MnmE [Clostridia bacterium]MBQ9792351.1 tRNA uridine-5-carboxymethylaminomethyl(34) synthesis GTPase MnmE [Clostridia bacterium]MBQ9793279.1 tRNA uridine-5-carboxymethylaminomethyl(34) synthesis GTPase MnmE [Clostridia bacterium]